MEGSFEGDIFKGGMMSSGVILSNLGNDLQGGFSLDNQFDSFHLIAAQLLCF